MIVSIIIPLYTFCALPSVARVGSVTNKAEITDVAALTQRFGADEIGVWQRAVVDDVCVTAHRAELHQVAFAEYLCIDTFVTFKMKFVLRIIFVRRVI